MNHTPKRQPMSAAEHRVYSVLVKMFRLKKYQYMNPSHQEIAEKLGISKWAVSKTISNLAGKGYLINPSNRRRSTQLIG